MFLNEKSVFQLPMAEEGRYIVRDDVLRGFCIVVGRRRKSFMVQAEHGSDGKRRAKSIVIGHAGDLSARDARIQAKLLVAQIANGELPSDAPPVAETASDQQARPTGVTLRQAWARYLSAHLERKERSPATIKGYTDHVERVLVDWIDLPLQVLGENPVMVAERYVGRGQHLRGSPFDDTVERDLPQHRPGIDKRLLGDSDVGGVLIRKVRRKRVRQRRALRDFGFKEPPCGGFKVFSRRGFHVPQALQLIPKPCDDELSPAAGFPGVTCLQ